MVWVRGRTLTVVDFAREGHVGLVIRRVEIYAIPAGREKDLSPEAIRAVGVGKTRSLRHCRTIEVEAGGSFRLIAIVKVREKGLTRAKRWPWIPGYLGYFGAMGFQRVCEGRLEWVPRSRR
jgi:hypothetical protein